MLLPEVFERQHPTGFSVAAATEARPTVGFEDTTRDPNAGLR